jgi:nitrogen fixation NifU-like protein
MQPVSYDDLIMDHIRSARNFQENPDADHVEMGVNPMCGDEVALHLSVRDGRVSDLTYQCTCCGVSMASASIMTTLVHGRRLAQAQALLRETVELLRASDAAIGEGIGPEQRALIDTVRRFPMRLACATLPWTTLERALKHVRNAALNA